MRKTVLDLGSTSGVIVETKNGLSFEFSTKWKVSIEKVDPDPEEDDEETKGNK